MDSDVELLGRLAVHYRMVSREQLAGAIAQQRRTPGVDLATILVKRNLLTRTDLEFLVKAQAEYRARKPTVFPPTHDPRRAQRVESGARPGQEGQRARKPTISPPAHDPRRAQRAEGGARSGQIPAVPARSAHPGPTDEQQRRNALRVEWLHRVLHHADRVRASDIHLHAECPVRLRLCGELAVLSPEPLRAAEAEATLRACMTDAQAQTLDDSGDVDFAYELPQVARFRVNVYREHHGLCGVFHRVPLTPPSLEELGLPARLQKLTQHRNGLVLITGPSGSGKSSTLAAFVQVMNHERSDHILTLEDPIEYRYPSASCLVNQREIGRHTHGFTQALRSALREDPDVICIGELRDLSTMELALSASETGHLVFSTMHTLGSVRTINRLTGAYPPDQQGRIRAMLSESLRAVLSQRLVPRADRSAMVLAHELLLVNQAAANLIREGRSYQIVNILQTGRQQGMRTFDESLQELLSAGHIDKDTALKNAENPSLFR